MSTPKFIDVHILQTVPPSNLNRDDAGSPKQAMFGGVRRARVSSQAWKRATRTLFAETLPWEEQGTRTQRLAGMLAKGLHDRGVDDDTAVRVAAAVPKALGISAGKRKDETAYLMFLGLSQVQRITEILAGQVDQLGPLKDAELDKALKELPIGAQLLDGHSVDVALFGRMVADQAKLNVDAAVQVAHAISTHPVEVEFDYFTAVDDVKQQDPEAEDVGAGMIGTVEFNSATLYRYATVGLAQLVENLGGSHSDAVDAVVQFIDGFARAMPTGHQNSFAHRTLPNAVVVTVRDDQPVNLVSAFEQPVRARDGLTARSLRGLAEELLELQANGWVHEPQLVAATYQRSDDGELAKMEDAFGTPRTFPDLLTEVRQALAEPVGVEGA